MSLQEALGRLTPWPSDRELSDDEWADYVEAARELRDADASDAERALAGFLDADAGTGDNERRVFLLQRIAFDLPRRAPAEQRRTYKGWVNWPEPDARGDVDLGWPVTWEDSRPRLLARFEGSMGPPYGAVKEYRHLRERFGFRDLPEP